MRKTILLTGGMNDGLIKKKKIYFLINSLEGGGAERVIVNLSAGLLEKYEVDIFTLKDVCFYELPKGVGYKPLSLVKSNIGTLLSLPFILWKWRKIVRSQEYNSGISFLEIANFLNILVNPKAIISFRIHLDFFRGFTGNIYKFLIKLLYPRASKIIVNSEENRHDLAVYLGVDIEKIYTIYNPVFPEKIEVLRQEFIEDIDMSKLRNKKVFITVGRLVEAKCHRKILEAFSALYQSGKRDFVWIIVGDGPERNALELYAQSQGIGDYILFTGAQKNPFKYLNLAHYFVYASRVEGFPNVLIEAIVAGLPIITSDFSSGAKECVLGEYIQKDLKYPKYGHNGILIDPEKYTEQFVMQYDSLEEIRQEKYGMERFEIQAVMYKWEEAFFE